MKDNIERLIDLYKNLPTELEPQTAPKTWEMVFLLMPKPCRVLVVGAGRGGISWILNEAGYDVVSCDLHPNHFQVTNMVCDEVDCMKPIKYQDNDFELVIATEVMEHLENPWFFMREVMRCLSDKGKFVFTTPNIQSLYSRFTYLFTGLFPYFREESFYGCYHVTPIFSWAVERCCATTNAKIHRIIYSRVEWPNNNDVPRHHRPYRKYILDILKPNKMLGEIAGYEIVKDCSIKPKIVLGHHYE